MCIRDRYMGRLLRMEWRRELMEKAKETLLDLSEAVDEPEWKFDVQLTRPLSGFRSPMQRQLKIPLPPKRRTGSISVLSRTRHSVKVQLREPAETQPNLPNKPVRINRPKIRNEPLPPKLQERRFFRTVTEESPARTSNAPRRNQENSIVSELKKLFFHTGSPRRNLLITRFPQKTGNDSAREFRIVGVSRIGQQAPLRKRIANAPDNYHTGL
eukprot:TRINITY_DN13148_c0_g1_i1.p1 TRINITY_DN13148_c0_g1~~TRINITY_DN13148_c0_g1_i1.p1  ORF type:complete len:226 (+),score=7.84 TRINITY_DN13148_c0_g1_i1:40-678(+)